MVQCQPLKRVVYVSCNPDTLAQNVADLCRPSQPGNKAKFRPRSDYTPFRPVRAVAVDLFPHADHCEAVMLLERD